MSSPLTFNLCTAMLHGYITSPSSKPLIAQKKAPARHGGMQELPAHLAPSPPPRHCCRARILRRAMRSEGADGGRAAGPVLRVRPPLGLPASGLPRLRPGAGSVAAARHPGALLRLPVAPAAHAVLDRKSVV